MFAEVVERRVRAQEEDKFDEEKVKKIGEMEVKKQALKEVDVVLHHAGNSSGTADDDVRASGRQRLIFRASWTRWRDISLMPASFSRHFVSPIAEQQGFQRGCSIDMAYIDNVTGKS